MDGDDKPHLATVIEDKPVHLAVLPDATFTADEVRLMVNEALEKLEKLGLSPNFYLI
jgi:hypothetical protein